MLFNSYEYILLFLPLTVCLYFSLNGLIGHQAGLAWLVVASMLFYAWWNPPFLALILISIFLNYFFGQFLIQNDDQTRKRPVLIIGIASNLFLLGYYKYTDFIIKNINYITGMDIPLLELFLPLGISFFTFQQIAFLVDCYRGEVKSVTLKEYLLFVSLFCQLIAGPIVNHKEMLPQFRDPDQGRISFDNFSAGLMIFFTGLAKKVIIADHLSMWADFAFDVAPQLSFLDAWLGSFAYTMQLYFDFSGYTDMAIGSALMLNIKLPTNFDSPYRSVSISDFWRRWHITLGRFLRDYLYIPLGGGKGSKARVLGNVLIVFILGGIWHGAGWSFFLWGAAHGVAVIIHRLWQNTGRKLPMAFSVFLTFMFVNAAWVLFRARTLADAVKVWKGMFWIDFAEAANNWATGNNHLVETIAWIAASFLIVFLLPNTRKLLERFQPRAVYAAYVVLTFLLCFILMENESPFLYWQF